MPLSFAIPTQHPTTPVGVVLLPHAHAAQIWRAEQTPYPESSTPPTVLAWGEWLSLQWSQLIVEGTEDRVLLNRAQEERLWAEVIASSPPPGALSPTSIPELARLARSGLARAADWQFVQRLTSAADTVDARLYADWVNLFLRRCEEARLLPAALLANNLARHLRAGHLPPPIALSLIGFDRRTPAQAALLAALAQAGCAIEEPSPTSLDEPAERYALTLPSEADELRAAVRLIAERGRTGQARTFALVTPEPDRHRLLLEPLCRELVAPELGWISADLSSTPWYISHRAPLLESPAIRAALDLLAWTQQPLELERLEQLLLSPYLDLQLPAEAAAHLRTHFARHRPLRPTIDLAAFLERLRSIDNPAATRPLQAFYRQLRRVAPHGARRSFPDWTEQIRSLLHLAGWPGSRTLTPSDYALAESWDGLLDQVASLGLFNERPDLPTVLTLLQAEAAAQGLPAANLAAPIQILSLEETAGLHFDTAILLGATPEQLPRPSARHPLLPQALQRELGIGEPTADLQTSSAALDALARHTRLTVLLAAPSAGDGEPELSPLAHTLNFRAITAVALFPDEVTSACTELETATEAEPLPALPTPDVPRGAEVLRLQAACGFRAFTSIRLGAEDPAQPTLGPDAREFGSLLHTALESVWQQIGSLDALRGLGHDGRRDLAQQAAHTVLQRLRSEAANADAWSSHYLQVLEWRFSSLLCRWLEEELSRSPFRIVAQEDEQILSLGPIRLKLRRDRIDEVDGGIALVDYKTGSGLSSRHWLEDRPEAPQLPAYALTVEDPATVRGVAFAQVRPGQDGTGWISLSDQPALFPKKGSRLVDMEAQISTWRTQLTSLAEAFAAGDARVNPKSYPQTCQYCAFRSLCRLDPATLLEQTPEGEEFVEGDQPHG